MHFLDPYTGLLEARGEDLDIVNLLATKWGALITNVEHFSGAPSAVSDRENIVYVGEETRHGFLGHAILLGIEHLVVECQNDTADFGEPAILLKE